MPEKFIPERWIASDPHGQMGDKLDRSLPFSYGPRGCLGRKWVLFHQKTCLWLLKMLLAWRISRCAWDSLKCSGSMILCGSMEMRLTGSGIRKDTRYGRSPSWDVSCKREACAKLSQGEIFQLMILRPLTMYICHERPWSVTGHPFLPYYHR